MRRELPPDDAASDPPTVVDVGRSVPHGERPSNPPILIALAADRFGIAIRDPPNDKKKWEIFSVWDDKIGRGERGRGRVPDVLFPLRSGRLRVGSQPFIVKWMG